MSDKIKKLTLEELLDPNKLKSADDKEILNSWRRLNALFSNAKEEKKSTETFVNAAIFVIREMKKRGFEIDQSLDLFQEAAKLDEDLKKAINFVSDNIQDEIMIVPDFVSLVGSAVKKDNPNDLDIVIRSDFDGRKFTIRNENLWLGIRNALRDGNIKDLPIHPISNQQGPRDDYNPLYHLVLKKAKSGIRFIKSENVEKIFKQKPLKLTKQRSNFRNARPDNEFERCGFCNFFNKESNTCDIVQGSIFEENLCDWIQSRDIEDVEPYKVSKEDWVAFGVGMIIEQPYQHIVVDVANTPKGQLVLIEDTMDPPHRFSLSRDFHIEHTSFEHHWTQEEVDRIIEVGKKELKKNQLKKANNEGVMIGFWIPKEIGEKIAIENGESVEDLHLTVTFHGNKSELGDDIEDKILNTVKEFVQEFDQPIEGRLNGFGRFNSSKNSDGKDVVFANFDAPLLPEFRQKLIDKLEDKGIQTKKDHGYTPHVTLAYVNKDEQLNPDIDDHSLVFNKITVAFGNEHHHIPFAKDHDNQIEKEASSMPNWKEFLSLAPDGDRIELGSGNSKAEGFIGIDKIDSADIQADLENGIPLQDNSAAIIRANHSLEHISNKEMIMSEIHRVLKPDGITVITVPSTKGEGAFAHPDHKSFWNKSSFVFWTNEKFIDNRPMFKLLHLKERGDGDRIYVDAVLQKGESIKKIKPFEKFTPPKPSLLGLTEAFEVKELIDWFQNQNEELPLALEPKTNGNRSVIQKQGDRIELWFEGQLGKNQLNKFPKLKESLQSIKGDYIFDADLSLLVNGKRAPRPDLSIFNRDEPTFEENQKVLLTVFDLPFFEEDLSDKPFEERRKQLEQLNDEKLKNLDNIDITPIRWAENLESDLESSVKWAFNIEMSEGLVAKLKGSPYKEGSTNDWFKLKKTVELKVEVISIQKNENNTFSYEGGLLLSPDEDWSNVIESDSKQLVSLGKTFNTRINANKGDIITVNILELVPNKEDNTLTWLGATVLDVDETRNNPFETKQAIDLSKRGGVLQESIIMKKVLFINGAPSKIEKMRNKTLTGVSGILFKEKYLDPLRLHRDEVEVITMIDDYLEDDSGKSRYPTFDELKLQKDSTIEKIKKHNPILTIALGHKIKNALDQKIDFTLPHPNAILKMGDSGEVQRKIRQINRFLIEEEEKIKKNERTNKRINKQTNKQDFEVAEDIDLEDIETRTEAAKVFWESNWQNMFPESGEGEYSYQHHWRGLTEEETKLSDKDLLNTTNSLHGDWRFERDNELLWGFTVFLGSAERNKEADGDRLITLEPEKNIRGSFKLAQPHVWLDIADDTFISEPEEVGATTQAFAKFFELDEGTYKIGVWHKNLIEIFVDGKNIKGRHLFQNAPIGEEGERIWLIDKPEDQTPIAEKMTREELIEERQKEGDKWLVWNNPNDNIKPEKIDLEKVKIEESMQKVKLEAQILKTDEEKQIVYGVVLENTIDAHEDIISPEEIEKAAHFFMRKSRVIGLNHKEIAEGVQVVESFIAPIEFEMGGQKVLKGSWVMAVHIPDVKLWKMIKGKELQGFSIGGFGKKEEVE